jgi:hypothetical protein
MSDRRDRDGGSRITELAFEEGRRLASDPNIVAVGHGAKLRAGQAVAGESLVYFVKQKLAGGGAALLATWPIPEQHEGVATDVVEVGQLAAASADRAPPVGKRGTLIDDPLVGGVATVGLGASSSTPGGYGTLGGQCFDAATKAPLVLSNAHVWGLTPGIEVIQPVSPSAILGAAASPATIGTPPALVQTRIPSALVPAAAFASSVAQTYLLTGGASDPVIAGQAGTPLPSDARTSSEAISLTGPGASLPPAGRRLTPTIDWSYQRFASSALLQASSSAARTNAQLLVARRLFSSAASYSAGQTVSLYAEVIPAGGAPATATAHLALALLYPLATGDKVITRVLRPNARQSVTTVTTSFQGFPPPARVGAAVLPALVGSFGIDATLPATYQTAPGLPANTLALRLPADSVRVFVPPSTQVELDLDLRGSTGPAVATAFNSAGDSVGSVSTSAGSAGRTTLTAAASEIVEVRLTGVDAALLYGATSRRASPEASAPLSYVGSVAVSELLPKGKWGASLFVQALDTGLTESANIVETAIGAASLISDCTFDVT